ncbi:MAG: hypothetical protein ACI88A_005019, partial [Paraglaciecola sp.]
FRGLIILYARGRNQQTSQHQPERLCYMMMVVHLRI